MLQVCYNYATILRCKKSGKDFAGTRKAFCVYPQGVLRMPARCFGQARKVEEWLIAPCAKARLTWRAGL